MKILLDTHILLWWLSDSKKLLARERTPIASPVNLVYVSAASVWEVEIKRALGKISLTGDWADHLEEDGFRLLPVTCEHAKRLYTLPPIHCDPFDRMLVCQARCEGLFLLTRGAVVHRYLEDGKT
jgi:PIN domain nuclease of toxin-antitoxin system